MSQIQWKSAVNGEFSNGGDWIGGIVPGETDTAVLAVVGGPFTVTVDSSAQSIESFKIGSNATLKITSRLTSAAAGEIQGGHIDVYGGALVVGGNLENSGVISVSAPSNESGSIVVASALTLAGGGNINLGSTRYNFIESGDSAATLTNLNNTISGSGYIGGAGLGILHVFNAANGVIDASGATSSLDLGRDQTVNAGLIEATGAAGLVLLGDLDNSGGGTLFAGAGSQVSINGIVSGGTLATAGNGVIKVGVTDVAGLDGTTSPIANAGNIDSNASGVLSLEGAITNAGTITLHYKAHLGIMSQGATLTGGGSVVLGYEFAQILSRPSIKATTLTNVDNTIVGVGGVGAGSLTVINEAHGVIDAVGAGALVVRTTGSVFTNDGLMEATAAGTLEIAETTVDGSGSGVILAGNGARVLLRDATVNGGTVGTAGDGVVFITRSGGALSGSTSPLTIAGDVRISDGESTTVTGAIVNTGSISLRADHALTTLFIGGGGATLSGGGQLVLNNRTINQILGAAGGSTLTNVDNKIRGAGTLGDANLTLINEAGGIINGNVGSGLTIDTGANTIQNAGKIAGGAAGGVTIKSAVHNTGILWAGLANLTVEGAVTGTGTVWVNAARADFASTFNQDVAFGRNASATGVLELAHSQDYHRTLSGFSKTGGSALDLDDIAFGASTKASYSGTTASGVLTVTDGAHTAQIHFAGNYTKSVFVVSDDGHGGTTVTDPAASASRRPSAVTAFVTAAATFAPSTAGPIALGAEPRHLGLPRLLAHRAAAPV